jgi:hypothetical protein
MRLSVEQVPRDLYLLAKVWVVELKAKKALSSLLDLFTCSGFTFYILHLHFTFLHFRIVFAQLVL